MRKLIVATILLGITLVLFDHLSSPSQGHVSAPASLGGCAPCGAPCPSVK